jgi:hypothetical protein
VTISPSDAAVAARSFPRRWRALFARAAGADEGAADVLARSGAIGLADEASTLLATTADRLPAAGVRPAVVGDGLDRLESAAGALADVIDHVPADDWGRGGSIDLLEAGIDGAAALLRQAERAIDEALAER